MLKTRTVRHYDNSLPPKSNTLFNDEYKSCRLDKTCVNTVYRKLSVISLSYFMCHY